MSIRAAAELLPVAPRRNREAWRAQWGVKAVPCAKPDHVACDFCGATHAAYALHAPRRSRSWNAVACCACTDRIQGWEGGVAQWKLEHPDV